MTVTVTPPTFEFVEYDNAEIAAIAEEAAGKAGLAPEAAIAIDVVESSPLGRAKVKEFEAGPPARVALEIEGGAFENLKSPRKFDDVRAREALGRLFFRLADVLDPAFGFEGDPESLSVPRAVAWDVYAIGRLDKAGYTVSHDRWQYLFRNRHGFTDESDLAFEKLWSGERLTWEQLRSLSESLKPDSEIGATRRVPSK